MADENPFARLFSMKSSGTIATLARLAPGSAEDNIEIELTISDPANASYDCISYDRSQEWDTVDIAVDGKNMSIPLPLEQALRSFRHSSKSSIIWADLLTGSNIQERSKQALVMKEVVQNARTVICFLGVGTKRSQEAYNVLQTLSNWWRQGALHTNFPIKNTMATHKNMEEMRTFLCSRNMTDIRLEDASLWEEVHRILASSYFLSTQAITDTILGKNVLLRSANGSISWDDFYRAMRATLFILPKLEKGTPSSLTESFQVVASMDISIQRSKRGETLELMPMIQTARDSSFSSDPREFVFAMLPIVTPSGRTKVPQPLPVADYSKKTEQVFIEAAKYIIHERQDLLIWWNECPPRCRKLRNLPSFVPDWSTRRPKSHVFASTNNGLRAWWDSIASPKRIRVDDENVLHVQAHAIDQIEKVTPVFTRENYRKLLLKAWKEGIKVPGETKETTIEKFWRAVVLDTDSDFGETLRSNVKPSNEMWIAFQSMLSEEMILEELGCTMEELHTTPALQHRARTNEACRDLGRVAGRSAPFEELVLRNSLGRRLFHCSSGRVGMTALETLDPEAESGDEQEGELPRAPNFDVSMNNPLGRMMMEGFMTHLAGSHPDLARFAAQAVQGQLPGQNAPGVRSGDFVVALVGGFQPYILRSMLDNGSTLRTEARYGFVGECHLQGAMDGECLKNQNDLFGGWKKVPLVDILII